MLSTSLLRAACALVLLTATSSLAAVGVAQDVRPAESTFEQLPSLRLVRGAQPKNIPLLITAEAGESWTLAVDVPWAAVAPASGIGPTTATLRFKGAALALADDPIGAVTVRGLTGGGTNVRSINIEWDIFPKVFEGELITGSDDAALRAYAKDPDHWPKDDFGGGWELWGFLPDATTHPDRASADSPVDVAERTACADGQTTGCTRPGQAGLTSGMKVDQGWLLSTGDPTVVVGVLDSGIRWSERNLTNKHYLNASELTSCPPPGANTTNPDHFVGFDVNGDGMFTIRDYDTAPWLDDINFNGIRDPQDLIWADNGEGPCSDGVDTEDNGYTDDISGWDFFWNDNDPSDDTDFGRPLISNLKPWRFSSSSMGAVKSRMRRLRATSDCRMRL